MKRRGVIRAFMLSPVALAVPAWAQRWTKDDVANFFSVFSDDELNLLSIVVDTIIPSDGKIGALSTDTHKFLARLISDCFDQEFQEEIKSHLNELNRNAINTHEQSLSDLNQSKREQELVKYSNGDQDQRAFFQFVKAQTIRGFQTCEEVMVNYHGYVMAPGFYDGNVNI